MNSDFVNFIGCHKQSRHVRFVSDLLSYKFSGEYSFAGHKRTSHTVKNDRDSFQMEMNCSEYKIQGSCLFSQAFQQLCFCVSIFADNFFSIFFFVHSVNQSESVHVFQSMPFLLSKLYFTFPFMEFL